MALFYNFFNFFIFQGRHTKTGQLAAIKVMNVTEVSDWLNQIFSAEMLIILIMQSFIEYKKCCYLIMQTVSPQISFTMVFCIIW